MKTFVVLALAVAVNAVDLEAETNTEVTAELQAMANASMINDYILAQVERMNTEETNLA